MKTQNQIKEEGRFTIIVTLLAIYFTLIVALLATIFPAAQAQSLNAGDLDPTFGNGGKVTTAISQFEGALDVLIQPDGKIIAVGTSMVRYNPDGSLDNTFGTGGIATVGDIINGAVLLSNGKIVAALS